MLEPPRPVRRLEVIAGAGGRRRWSADEKARILEEAMAPGAVVSEAARRTGMSHQHLITWLSQGKQKATEGCSFSSGAYFGCCRSCPTLARPGNLPGVGDRDCCSGRCHPLALRADGATLAMVLQALKSLR
jgi:transposase